MEKSSVWTRAFRDTLPVLAGYVVLGAGFGLMMRAEGYGLLWALAMSVFVFAGAMQYLAVGLLTGGASLLTAAIITLLVNARHILYGLSLLGRYRDVLGKPYLIFGLTDETYSLVCRHKDESDEYCFCVTLLDHGYWVAGTLLGSLAGELLSFNTEGIDFALTALFLTVALEQWLSGDHHLSALIGIGASVSALVMFGAESFLLPAMGLILLLLIGFGKGAAGRE